MKRLIEVDLPIKKISAHSRREKSIRHGHISTLHIWWARRPLAACRAVILAALLPDPTDRECPQEFIEKATEIITNFARKVDENLDLLELCDVENRKNWTSFVKQINKKPLDITTIEGKFPLQQRLFDFIADFANWDCSTVPLFLETARNLVNAAYDEKPLVADPFAGGGSIPLEALRVGADAFASDLNPVAVLLNKVVLEYIPKYGQKLADAVRTYGEQIKKEAEKELQQFYPKDPDGATPIAYLWARTIKCEGPGCGAEIPLMRSMYLAKKSNRFIGLIMKPNKDKTGVNFQIAEPFNPQINGIAADGTVKRANAICPCCGYTTPAASVRKQLKEKKGGANDAKLLCVVTTKPDKQGRFYRLPTESDYVAVKAAENELKKRIKNHREDYRMKNYHRKEHLVFVFSCMECYNGVICFRRVNYWH
jgi:adenine-specific DNA methylase